MPDKNYSEVVTLAAVGIIVFFVVTGLLVYILLFYQKKRLQHRQQIVNKEKEYAKQLLQTQLEIQEQTLKNISQEIHDNIGQALSLAKLNINTMDLNEPSSLQNKINDSRELITKAIQDLRDLSKSLNTDYVIELGLARAIEYELEIIKRSGDYKVDFGLNGKPYRLEDQQELILFRIFQEAVNNIMKHSNATLVSVKLLFEPGLFTLQVADNGSGFEAGGIKKDNYTLAGLGIRNMYNRATIINGDLSLTSAPEKGTTIIITLPVTLQNKSL
jgi:signal transduction histidine kinase